MKQPRVPEYREADGVSRYIKSLILFLKDFSMSVWVANNQRKKEIENVFGNMPEIEYPVTSVNGKTGDVELGAGDVGALGEEGTAADSTKFDGMTWAEAVLALYPVGSIYMSVDEASPASCFGGTWEWLKDRFLLGTGDNYALGDVGGAATHMLTADELPNITDDIALRGTKSQYSSIVGNNTEVFKYEIETNSASTFALDGSGCITRLTMSFGGDQPHNNMPPYLAVNMWKRVA